MVQELFVTLRQIPAEFYDTVVGALIALGGVALSNKSAMQQLARQLEHATSERRRQEEADLRRSVLLGGVDAFAGLSNHLSRFADLRASAQEDSAEVQRRAGALAKVQLAVSGETLRVIQHAAGVYGRAAFELTLLRGRLVAAGRARHDQSAGVFRRRAAAAGSSLAIRRRSVSERSALTCSRRPWIVSSSSGGDPPRDACLQERT